MRKATLSQLRTLLKIVASVVLLQVPDLLSHSAGRESLRRLVHSARYKSMKRTIPSRAGLQRTLTRLHQPEEYIRLLDPFQPHLNHLLSAVLLDAGGGGGGEPPWPPPGTKTEPDLPPKEKKKKEEQ